MKKTSMLSRLFAVLLATVMVITMLPFPAATAEQPSTFQKVTAAPENGDWSGTYLIVNEENKAAFDGSLEKLDAVNDYKAVEITDAAISAKKALAFTIEKMEDGYSIKAANGKYIHQTSDKNGLQAEDTAKANTIKMNENGTVDIVSGGAYLRFNAASDQMRFRYYKSSTYTRQKPITLYKLTERESGIIAADKLQNGDKVVIFNPDARKALSSEYSGYYNKGADVTLTDGKLTGYTDADIWTVGITEKDGEKCYTFSTEAGKKLSMDTSYTSTPLDKANDTWKVKAVDGKTDTYYIDNTGRSDKYRMQWYAKNNNWSAYYGTGVAFEQQFYLVVDKGSETPDPTPGAMFTNGDKVVIYNPANMKALSTEYSGFYNKGTDVTLADGKLNGYTAADVWTVGVNADGTYTFSTSEGKKLSMGTKYTSTPLDDVNTAWKITDAKTDGCYYIQNAARSNYLEWYSDKGNWSSYSSISDETLFAQAFYRVTGEIPTPQPSEGPEVGSQVVIYNQNANATLAAQNDNTESPSINKAAATIKDGKLTSGNGAVVFTVEQNGAYYRFKNEAYGYLCSNGTGNNAFYSKDASEDADWTLAKAQGGALGYHLESRTAKYNGKYSQYLEYFSDSFKTYSMYSKTGNLDYTIYAFSFYPVADGVNVNEGIVNVPTVDFGKVVPAYVGKDYELTFTVDAPFGVQGDLAAKLGSDILTVKKGEDGKYIAVIPASKITGTELTVAVTGTDNKGVDIKGDIQIEVMDEPSITDLTPANGSQTGENKRPTIGAVVVNAGENPTVTLKMNDETVKAEYKDGKITYKPTADMKDGRVDVELTVIRKDGKTASQNWYFTVGKTRYQLYFGQLHSHTQYSDGAGSLTSALEYIKDLPDSANVDFVAFTDHSNYFDSKSAPNPEEALYDVSKVKDSDSSHSWSTYKKTIADFNASQSDVIAIGGFEMTWSGGPGHINTFNTEGVVSRNNSTLNNKTGDAGLKKYYNLLSNADGKDSLSQFNHPGTTFGNFVDFSYWDAAVDTRIQMVEVGNGEGQIGAGGYYPSYEQYIMALDKGWHVAPTNNQDNHKGRWGNANSARDVIITDNFTEEGIYEAIRAKRMYATEDNNLELGYTVNGQVMGSSITVMPENLDININFNDPDKSDSISKVEIVANSGKVIQTWDTEEALSKGTVSVTIDPDYTYYFVRVTEGDGDLAVTSPVWVGETLKLGISSVACSTSTPVTDEELTLTTTLFNSEAKDATIKSLTYTIKGGEVIGTDATGYTVNAGGTQDVTFNYTPNKARTTTVTVTAVVEQDGKEYTFTKDITLDVQDAEKMVYIGIDASHYNEYVAGNYKDSMGNFGKLAAKYDVRTVTLNTSEELIDACSNPKYKALILTAPSRRLEAAQKDPKTYSTDELTAISTFNAGGGTVILAGWSDNYENYDVIKNNKSIQHMAATQNEVLSALGSRLRISDDATYDDERSKADGVEKWRLYFSTYNMGNPLVNGVEVDPDHPYDKLYTERFSHYGGASIYAVDADGNPTSTLPSTVSPVVYGHSTTYSVDVDQDGLGGSSTPKYSYSDGDNRLMVMASEKTDGKGMVIVSGAAFMSNFEVQATISDSGSEKNYSNYKICENLVSMLNPTKISKIKDVQAEPDEGVKFTVEGIVTSNASGYDKNTAFFDCIYVQDDTAGINCFPVAGEFKVGDKVRVTGTTSSYQGERQLNVTKIEKVGDGTAPAPTEVSAEQINNRNVLGSLVKIKGTVTDIEYAAGLVQTIMVKDSTGNEARVFIDGYITPDKGISDLKVGSGIEAVGLASWDDTFKLADGTSVAPRIRIRDRADIVCTVSVIADTTAPTGRIDVNKNTWDRFLEFITFGLYYNEKQSVTITAEDDSGQDVKIEYYVDENPTNTPLTKQSLEAKKLTAYTEDFTIEPDGEFVVYAKLTDQADNAKWISSDGIVIDSTAPVIIGAEDGKTYCKAVNVIINERHIKTVSLNGKNVELDTNNGMKISPSDGKQKLEVIDESGNKTVMAITVNDGHTPEEDDGDCTTAIRCKFCHEITTPAKEHDFTGEWKHNSKWHWHECKNEGCTKHSVKEKHNFEWVTDEKATSTKAGVKHEECKICGLRRNENTVIPSTSTPETGDASNLTLWISLMILSAGATFAVSVKMKKSKMRK